MRGPPPRTPPHNGEGIGRRFALITQIVGWHTLPLVGRVGRASGRGGGLRMLIVGVVQTQTTSTDQREDFHGTMMRSSSLSSSVKTRPSTAMLIRPTYMVSTERISQAFQIM